MSEPSEMQSKNRIILALVSFLLGLTLASMIATGTSLTIDAMLLCTVLVSAIFVVKIVLADMGNRLFVLLAGFIAGVVLVVFFPTLRLTTLDASQLALILIGLFLVYKV